MRKLALALLLAAAPARGGQNPGSTSAPILQVPLGSRALGMGGAFTAVASDISALYYNPAGLSRLNAHEAAFTFFSGLSDDKVQHFAYGGPLPVSGISGNGYSSFGASMLFAQSGTIEVNRVNADGSLASSENISAGSDFVGAFGYAERVGTTPFDVSDGRSYGINHFIGVSGKYVKSTLLQTYNAATFTADVGYLVNSPEAGVTFGMSALNLGGKLRYVEQDEPLPTMLRAGVAYQGAVPSLHNYTLALDGEYLSHEKIVHINAGYEYFWLKTYGARMGYQFLNDAMGFTMGLGFRWNSRLLFDYAWVMSRALSDSHRVTISYRFGGVAPAARARARRPFIERAPDREQFQDLDEKTPETFDRPASPRSAPRPDRGGAPGWIY
jgi:hypothetical protein